MAYKTEIQVKVNGVAQLRDLETTLTRVNALQTRIKKKAATKFVNIGRLNSETKALDNFNRTLEKNIQLQERAAGVRGGARTGGATAGGGGGRASGGRLGGGVNRLESLALGAGFPLLFGGGAGQVLGGIAGSFVGSGFGGQILGSAIGGEIEEFLGGIANLGNALSDTKPNLDALTEALGGANSEVGERIRLIERLEGKTAALEEAQRELTNLIGGDGIASIQQYAQDTNAIGSEFSKFFTIMQANIAELINSSGILKSIIEQVGRATLLAQAERGKEKDPQLALLFAQRENAVAGARGPGLTAMSNLQFMGPDPVEEGRIRLEIEDQIIKRQAELNAARNAGKQAQLEELRLRFQALENEKRLKAEAREKEQARIAELRIQRSGVQAQLNQLANEQKIFGIRQQAATAGIQLEQARFNAELSTFQLQETRLQRELQGLQKKNAAFNNQKRLVNQIAENQVRQAQIEFEVGKLRIQQNVEQAKAAKQQIDFETRRIKLQIQMLRLKAMEERNDKLRAARLKEVNAATKQANSLTSEMVEAADRQLQVAISIGREQEKVANNILKGKIESIEAKRVEAERAVIVRSIAAAAGKAADETARMNSSMSKGPRKGRTASTSMRIDPDVEAAVKASKPMGFRDIFELTKALDEAQMAKNRRTAMSQPGPNSFAGSSAYGVRASFGGGSSTAAVNINTGPVMQFDNEKYVNMKDFELALNQLSRSQATSSRSYAGRTYGGVG